MQKLHVCGPTSSIITEQPEDLTKNIYELYGGPTPLARYNDKYRITGHNVNLLGQTVEPYIYKKEIYVFSMNPGT